MTPPDLPKSDEVVTDSAGTSCRYTPIEDLKPGDVFIIGWRSTVVRVDHDDEGYRIVTEWMGGEHVDQANPAGTLIPVEVVAPSTTNPPQEADHA